MTTPWEDLIATGLITEHVDLAQLTTYKLGGPARYLAEPETIEQLSQLARALGQAPVPVLVLGRGSNLVVSDQGYFGLVVRLGRAFGRIEIGEVVIAGGQASLPQVARSATGAGRRRLEFMIGIPGTAGGGVRQNAGCFGSQIDDVLFEADVFDLAADTLQTLKPAALDLSYRHSCISSTQVVVDTRFVTEEGDPEAGLVQIKEHTRWRRSNQPGGTLNAGSVFKNPTGDHAGRVIDQLGLKGLSVGGASVSEKHANFFVALPGTKAIEVYLLVEQVAARVRKETGIELEREIQFAGAFGPTGEEAETGD